MHEHLKTYFILMIVDEASIAASVRNYQPQENGLL